MLTRDKANIQRTGAAGTAAPLLTRRSSTDDVVVRSSGQPLVISRKLVMGLITLFFIGFVALQMTGGNFTLPSLQNPQKDYARNYRISNIALERGTTVLGETSWLVTGTALNTSRDLRDGPRLEVKLLVKKSRLEVASGVIDLRSQPLPSGAAIRFRQWLRAPEGKDLDISVKARLPAEVVKARQNQRGGLNEPGDP